MNYIMNLIFGSNNTNNTSIKQPYTIISIKDDSITQLDDPITQLDNPITQLDNPITQLDNPITQLDDPITQLDNTITQLDNTITQLDDKDIQLDDKDIQIDDKDRQLDDVDILLDEECKYLILRTDDTYSHLYNNELQHLFIQLKDIKDDINMIKIISIVNSLIHKDYYLYKMFYDLKDSIYNFNIKIDNHDNIIYKLKQHTVLLQSNYNELKKLYLKMKVNNDFDNFDNFELELNKLTIKSVNLYNIVTNINNKINILENNKGKLYFSIKNLIIYLQKNINTLNNESKTNNNLKEKNKLYNLIRLLQKISPQLDFKINKLSIKNNKLDDVILSLKYTKFININN